MSASLPTSTHECLKTSLTADIGCEGPPVDDAALRPAKPPRLTTSEQSAVLYSELQSSTPILSDAGDGSTSVAVPVTVSLLCNEPDAGLGLDVTGDQTGAVFVRDVMEHGPAQLTGKIHPGD